MSGGLLATKEQVTGVFGYNEDYWDAHVAWFANANLTLIGAYVNAGDEKSKTSSGLGDGVVVSAQYAF